ncbi:CRP/FNR family cyclic AMP-dependent transcriptional regulator [Catenulispora sp. MAP12-49]|uniref:Crp/Fnr family transcriptional regulator n=1 Tax=unclassified Catenulispora TaxID=414885 RepID=UPI003513E94C
MGSDGTARAAGAPRGTWLWPANTLLGGLDPDSRDLLLRLGRMVQYGSGRIILRETDQPTFVFVLLDGVVKATGRAQDTRDALLAVRIGGDLVGELGVLDGQPRSATVTSCGVVVGRVVTRNDFLACLRENPRVAESVQRSVVGKLRSANSRRIDFAGSDAPTRVARVLYDLATTYGTREGDGAFVAWPLTQPELATLIGAAEPTVHKALRDLREAGVIATGYRRLRINDLDKLRKLAFS